MILILSLTYDKDVDLVIDWLRFLNDKTKIFRLNFDDLKKFNFYLDINNEQLFVNNVKVSSIYLRKFGHQFINHYIKNQRYFNYFKKEIDTLLGSIQILKDKITIIGNFNDKSTNKIIQLLYAKEIGLLIPETYITNKTNLIKNGRHITKGIRNSPTFNFKNFESLVFVKNVKIEKLPNEIFPSLFQKKVDKMIELRVFFIKNSFSTIAIFNEKTDVRNGDFENYTEFNLPNVIKEKILLLACKLEITTGSIDFLITKKYEFIFLEINVSGVFDMVAKPLNKQLHKQVAIELLKYINE